MKRGSLLIFIVGIACFSVLLLSKIIRIDYGILAMNSENVTESTYPLFVKYNGEWEYNIYMLPDGKKYIRILNDIIPEGSILLSDKHTAGSISKGVSINPIYAMPGYPDLSRFTRFLLMHKLITSETIITNLEMFIEQVYLSGIDYILLNNIYLDKIKRHYPRVLEGYMNNDDILELKYSDSNIYLFKVLKNNMREILATKYSKYLWKLSTKVDWNFNIHSGHIHNVLDLNNNSAVSFQSYPSEESYIKFHSDYSNKNNQITLLVNKLFVQDLSSLLIVDTKNNEKFNYSLDVTESDNSKNKIIINLNSYVYLDGLKVGLMFKKNKGDNIYKIFDISL